MRIIRITIYIYASLVCATSASAKSSIPELYKELNAAISKREYYINLQQEKIDGYKAELRNASTLQQEYEFSKILTEEYAYFNLDSVLLYSDKAIDIATELNDKDTYSEALIRQAYVLSWQGYFHECIEILQSIDVKTLPSELLSNYYDAYMMAYHFRQQTVMSAQHRLLYRTETLKYTDLYLAAQPLTSNKSASYWNVLAFKCYQLRDYKTAIVYLKEVLHTDNIRPNSKVNTLYMLYLSYTAMGKGFQIDAETYLLQLAILSIKVVKLREMSLIKIALLQNEKGNYSLALKYIDTAIANMELCQNTDFKKTAESARFLIEKSYSKHESRNKKISYHYAVLSIVLSVSMLGAFIYIRKKNRLLKAAQQAFMDNSEKLSASNNLKDSIIVNWLNTSSSYINKLQEFKKFTLTKISTKQSLVLLKSEIEDLIDIKEERQKLYSDFDNTFYEIHPDFISRINSLLLEEYHFSEDSLLDVEKNRASTELRILALIKLGVNDNKQIASFLQFTVQSVYNYRSGIKARAINPDTFDNDFEKI